MRPTKVAYLHLFFGHLVFKPQSGHVTKGPFGAMDCQYTTVIGIRKEYAGPVKSLLLYVAV